MWDLDHEEDWTLKNWCFRTMVWEKTLESPLDCKEIKPVNPKGNQFWIFIGRTDAEAETPILWSPDMKNWLIGKDPDAGKDWRQEEEGMDRGRDGWMASMTRWTRVWASSRRWWRTGKPGVLQSTGPKSWTRLSDWTTATNIHIHILFHIPFHYGCHRRILNTLPYATQWDLVAVLLCTRWCVSVHL